MLGLVFDTETTSLFERKKPINHPDQPDLVQIAALLIDLEDPFRDPYSILALNVYTEMPIHEKALEAHGVTPELSKKTGVPRRVAVAMFHNLLKMSSVLIAHNTAFDVPIMRTAYDREQTSDEIVRTIPKFCTMMNSTQICKIPSPWKTNDFKWPNLTEAFTTLVNPGGFTNAHNALPDALACLEVYRAMRAKYPELFPDLPAPKVPENYAPWIVMSEEPCEKCGQKYPLHRGEIHV